MKKRFITKSSEDKSDFISGHASKPYINEGIHLLHNSCTTTSSFIRDKKQVTLFCLAQLNDFGTSTL